MAVAGHDNLLLTGPIAGNVVLPGGTLIAPDSATQAAREAEGRARRSYLEHLQRQCQSLPLAALGGDETSDQDITLDQAVH